MSSSLLLKVLSQTLEQEALAKIALNQKMKLETEQEIKLYNQSVNEINNCLMSLNLLEHQLPTIELIEAQTIAIESQEELSHLDSVKASNEL